MAVAATVAVGVAIGPLAAPATGAVPPVRSVLGPGTLDSPGAVALDAAGDVFVADTGHCRVVVIGAGNRRRYGVSLRMGRPVTIAGGQCGGSRSFGHPTGLAVDSTGAVYVAEANEQRVRVIEPSGVARLADHMLVVAPEGQSARSVGIHQAVGGQLGGDQLQILDAVLG